MPALALLPSPFLGPAVWGPVVPELTGRGWDVVTTPPWPTGTSGPQDVIDAVLAALPADRDIVLVPHSNAGLYVPLIGSACGALGNVFVDAGLPPRAGRTPLVPADRRDFLAALADRRGMLPPWTHWWGPDQREALIRDADLRARVESEQLRLPLSYADGSLDVPEGWDRRPAGYLAFGETYAQERDRAARWGWPVLTLPGRHLHLLDDPAGVAGALAVLLGRIGVAPG